MTKLKCTLTLKKYLSLLLLISMILITFQAKAQRVNLDKKHANIRYVQLPTEPILDKEKRTYTYSTNIGTKYMDLRQSPQIIGFTEVESDPTLRITLSIYEVILQNVEVKETEKVNKDKEGNVKSRTKYYQPTFTYTTSGKYTIINEEGKSKDIKLGKRDNTYQADKYTKQKEAYNYIKNNQYELKQTFYRQFAENSHSHIIRVLNKTYGYPTKLEKVRFFVVGAKKHPEYKGFQKNFKEISQLFSSINATHYPNDMEQQVAKIIKFNEQVLSKYKNPKKKKEKKVRSAALYNLSQLYYWMDMPKEAFEYANLLVENGFDKRDGKEMKKNCKDMIEIFRKNQLTSRHFKLEE